MRAALARSNFYDSADPGWQSILKMHYGAVCLLEYNAVLADHDKELMAIPGVVGVYVGVLRDQKSPCLKVMLARRDTTVLCARPTSPMSTSRM